MPVPRDVVRIVNSLNQGQGAEGAGAAVKIVADERTNSILLTGEKSQRLRLKALIINMDTPLATGGDTQVRYLRYADAEKIADKLKGQATASAKAQGGPPAGSPGRRRRRPMWMPASPSGRMSPPTRSSSRRRPKS